MNIFRIIISIYRGHIPLYSCVWNPWKLPEATIPGFWEGFLHTEMTGNYLPSPESALFTGLSKHTLQFGDSCLTLIITGRFSTCRRDTNRLSATYQNKLGRGCRKWRDVCLIKRCYGSKTNRPFSGPTPNILQIAR